MELNESVENKGVPKSEVERRDPYVLYKDKKIPRQKEYKLEFLTCNNEVKRFINHLKEKFNESSIQVTQDKNHAYQILINGENFEDPSCKLSIHLQQEGEKSTRIEFDLDFKAYYKKIFKIGLIGILVVFGILTVSLGALNLSFLLSPGYLFGSAGLFAVSFLILGFFAWNKSLAFHTSALEALYWRLDKLEATFIDQALQEFRKKPLELKPKEEPDNCFHCSAPVPIEKERGEFLCDYCKELLLTCSVCLLNINYREVILRCPHCNSPAHRDHVREWLKVKSYCPYCKQKIHEEELIESE